LTNIEASLAQASVAYVGVAVSTGL